VQRPEAVQSSWNLNQVPAEHVHQSAIRGDGTRTIVDRADDRAYVRHRGASGLKLGANRAARKLSGMKIQVMSLRILQQRIQRRNARRVADRGKTPDIPSAIAGQQGSPREARVDGDVSV